MSKGYLKNVVNESYIKNKGELWRSNPAVRAILIDLYTGRAEGIPAVEEEIDNWIEGLKPIKGKGGIITYKGEEYMVVITGNV
jgi:hypothetical protein